MKGVSKLNKGEASPSMLVQGLLYLGAGLWPLLHYASFSRFATPQAPPNLVKAFGAIVSVTGGLLVIAGLRAKRESQEPWPVGGSSLAAVMTALELMGGFRGKITALSLFNTGLETLVAGVGEAGHRSAVAVGDEGESDEDDEFAG